MPTAEIIAIGTELLLGEIQDTNTTFLARRLRNAGIDLYRTTIIGDNANRIASAIRESLERSHIVITTGGLGPTVDDPTRQAVGLAFGTELEFRPELWEQIENRFARFNRQATENNRRQAYVPAGAEAIENPVGTAPSFYILKNDRFVISLPGVPREMEHIFDESVLPILTSHFQLQGTIRSRVLHLAGIGESQIDEWIGDLESNSNPTVGLAAHSGQIDVRITAKAESSEEVESMLNQMTLILMERLGENVFGVDDTALEQVVLSILDAKRWTLGLIECGLEGNLKARFESANLPEKNMLQLKEPCTPDFLLQAAREIKNQSQADCVLAASLIPGKEVQVLHLVEIDPSGEIPGIRYYGGPPSMRNAWAVNTALDFLRRR